MKLIDMRVAEYLDILASDAPAPGGGSAAALCGAQGAGLAAMVIGQTISKKRFEAEWPLCERIIPEVKELFGKLTAQVDRDTDAYNLVAAAYKLPRETDDEKAIRRGKIAEATLVATEVPFETLALSVSALELAHALLGHYNTNCASDLGLCALNLYACAHGAWLNVLINLGGVKDEAKAEQFAAEGKKLIEKADLLAAEIQKTVEADIAG